MRRRRRLLGIALAVAALAVAALGRDPVARHLRAAHLLARLSETGEASGGVEARDTTIAGHRTRVYTAPSGGPPVLLVHGVHPAGIDEPRFIRFARLLADGGLTVATPHVRAMTEMTLDPTGIEVIADAAEAFAREQGAPSVGVVGISFGGGLALLAAAERPSAIHAVWAIGAHYDLPGLVAWWTGGDARGPSGESPEAAPHRYGAEVLAYAFAEDFFAPEHVEAGRAALWARITEDEAEARRLREAAPPALRARLREAARPARAIATLADRRRADLRAISPRGRLGPVRARVHLLHGRRDPVVASTESLHLARELGDRARGVLRTDLLGHADVAADAPWLERWALVHHAAGALADLSEP